MKFIEKQNQTSGQVVPPSLQELKSKPKQLLRLGCAALAVVLAAGSVPFLRGFAAEEGAEEAVVSGSDIVSASDNTAEESVETFTETVEPKVLNDNIVDIGTCGDGVNWTLDTDGVLTISGSGPMQNNNYLGSHQNDIKRVVIEDGVTSLVSYAFASARNLTSASIAGSVTSINSSAFISCSSLSSLEIAEGVTSIGNMAFMQSGLTSLTIPSSVTSIGNMAFMYCQALKTVNIPGSVTTIPMQAFMYCSALTSVNIADGVTSIDQMAFAYCEALPSINIPGSVTSVGNQAFMYCRGLTSATLAKGVKTIGDIAFYSTGLTSVTLPEGLESIGQVAFYQTKLTDVKVPDSVTSMREAVFYGCTSLVSATLPKELAAIPMDTFSSCTALKTLTIGYVTNVESNALKYTDALETVYYPCNHTVDDIQGSFPSSPQFVPHHAMTKTDAVAATCTEVGNIDYWTCNYCHSIFSDEEGTTEITEADTIVAASGHDWYAWTAVEGQPGLLERDCANCSEHETRIHPFLEFVVAEGNGQTYTKGSQEPITIKFDKENVPDLKNVNVYEMFQNGGTIDVTAPDGTVTTLGASDFTAAEGSLDVTLSAEYLEGLENGNYTLTVTFVVAPDYEKTSAPASFTVASPAPSSTDTPATGEGIWLVSVSLVLLLLAAGGAAYAFIRRRRIAE